MSIERKFYTATPSLPFVSSRNKSTLPATDGAARNRSSPLPTAVFYYGLTSPDTQIDLAISLYLSSRLYYLCPHAERASSTHQCTCVCAEAPDTSMVSSSAMQNCRHSHSLRNFAKVQEQCPKILSVLSVPDRNRKPTPSISSQRSPKKLHCFAQHRESLLSRTFCRTYPVQSTLEAPHLTRQIRRLTRFRLVQVFHLPLSGWHFQPAETVIEYARD